tara:strand:+ start:328 stop:507 length:180 start_codon:yes stop_codon:yes gene_type:complete
MSKRATTKGMTPKEQSQKLHMVSKKASHTGAQALVEHIDMPNVKVTQKVRKAQDSRKRR